MKHLINLLFALSIIPLGNVGFGSAHFQEDTLCGFPPPAYENFLVNDSLNCLYVIEDDSTYTYSMIAEDLDYFLERYPKVVHPVKMGNSEFGLEMKTVRIGRETLRENAVFLVGNIHGREDFSSKLLMKFMNIYLLSIDGSSTLYPDAAALLDSIDIYIMPVANPDGLKIAQQDFNGINDSLDMYIDSIACLEGFPEWKSNGKGIDLNRTFDDGNFEAKKGASRQVVPTSEGYMGEYPAQAIETQHIQDFVARHQPLITASFHTKGNVLFWADEQTHPSLKNVDTRITEEIAFATGFEVAEIGKYASEYGCGLENYVRSKYGLIGMCIELSRGDRFRQQHADNQFNPEVWNYAWSAPYIFIRDAVRYADQIRVNSREYRSNFPQ